MKTDPTTIEHPISNARRENAPVTKVHPWPMQPRKTFDADYIKELAGSIGKHGVCVDLLCRPLAGKAGEFEIIGGECRWRAAQLVGLAELPLKVCDLSDGEAFEIALLDNMKRRDLTTLEEADAFAVGLAQQEESGPDGQMKPRYASVLELADKIGVSESYVRQRLSLRKLTKGGREALNAERISFAVARIICTCPSTIIAQVEDEVLHPEKHDEWWEGGETMNPKETQELIRNRYVRELRGAPFELNDANLVPIQTNEAGERVEGGACLDCPWNSANQKDEDDSEGRKGRRGGRNVGEGKFCLNPTCYAKKVDVHVAAVLEKAKAAGCKVLTEKETEKAITAHGGLHYQTPYVKLNEKPGYEDRAKSVDEKKCPTWKKIVTGEATPEVVIAVDKRGHVHELVERKLAVVAARKNGTEKFLSLASGRGQSAQRTDVDEQRKKDAEKQKLRGLQCRAIVADLVAAFEDYKKKDGAFYAAMVPLAVRHAGHAGCTFVAKRRGIEGQKTKSISAVVEAYGEKLLIASGLAGFVFECLLSQDFSYADSPHCSGDPVPQSAKPLLKLFKIDPAAIKKRVEQEWKEKQIAKKKPVATTAKNGDGTNGKKGKDAKPAKSRGGLTPEGRARLVATMKARWAGRKAKATKKAAKTLPVDTPPANDPTAAKDSCELP